MNKAEKKSIAELVDSENWKIIKKMFSKKEKQVNDYMRNLDLDDPEKMKEFKTIRAELNAFDSFILELEAVRLDYTNVESINEINNEFDKLLNNDE